MADQHNADIPAMGNQISADIPDIKENLEWHKDVLQMLAGWKNGTIATVGPPNHRATFVYSSTTAISIGAGSYFHDGTTRQTVFWDAAITFTLGSGGSNAASDDLGASEWHYIYLDDSAIVTQGDSELDADCFLNDTTAPTWSAAKHGWYNGSDRCIFAVLTNGSNQIVNFLHDGSRRVTWVDYRVEASSTDVDASWTPVDMATSVPGFSTKAVVQIEWWGGNDGLQWAVNGAEPTYGGRLIKNSSAGVTDDNIIAEVYLDTSQIFELIATGNGDDIAEVACLAWDIPGGM